MPLKECIDCKGTFEDSPEVEVCPGCGSRNGWKPEAQAEEKAPAKGKNQAKDNQS